MLRILCIGNTYPPHAMGGYEGLWLSTTRALQSAGHRVSILTTDHREPGVQTPECEESHVHRTLRWYWRDHAFPSMSSRQVLELERHNAAAIRQLLAIFSPDVACWWAMGGMSLSLIEQVHRAGIPAVGVVGDAWPVYGPSVDAWTRAWMKRPRAARLAERVTGIPARLRPASAAAWLFISEFVRDQALSQGWNVVDAPVAHPGVDRRRFSEHPARPWRGRMLYAGRLDPRKGIASAIEALAFLPVASTLTVDGAGDPQHAAELRALTRSRGVHERVAFQRSSRETLVSAYAEADAVVFPVRWAEPWGLVPLEAMAIGRPVVATATGGAAEYLRDGENCLLFEPGDARALAASVRRLGEDPVLRARLRRGGLATVAGLTDELFQEAVRERIECAGAA